MAYDQKVKEEWIVSLVDTLYRDRTLYLIGTADKGPLNTPVVVRSLEQAIYRFGEQGTLIEAYRKIEPLVHEFDVALIKSTGAHAKASLRINHEFIEENAFEFVSVDANSVANGIQIELDPDHLHILHPVELGGHRVTYRLNDYGVMSELAQAINDDAEAGRVSLNAVCYYNEWPVNCPFYPCNPSLISLQGGRDGLHVSDDDYYIALEATYEALQGVEMDVLIPIQAYLDATPIGIHFYEQLQTFCLSQIEHGCFTHGVMGLNVIEGETEQEKMERLKRVSALATRSLEAFDDCAVISVVATDVYYNYLSFVDNGYLAYGVMLSQLAPNQNPTNQRLHDSIQLKDRLSLGIENEMSALGFVSFRYSPLKVCPVVTLDVTFTDGQTGLKYYHNLRMCEDVCLMVKELVDSYIGSSLTEITEELHLQQELDYLMYQLSSRSIIKEYDFDVRADATSNTLYLDLSLKTKYMVSSVSIYGDLTYQSV